MPLRHLEATTLDLENEGEKCARLQEERAELERQHSAATLLTESSRQKAQQEAREAGKESGTAKKKHTASTIHMADERVEEASGNRAAALEQIEVSKVRDGMLESEVGQLKGNAGNLALQQCEEAREMNTMEAGPSMPGEEHIARVVTETMHMVSLKKIGRCSSFGAWQRFVQIELCGIHPVLMEALAPTFNEGSRKFETCDPITKRMIQCRLFTMLSDALEHHDGTMNPFVEAFALEMTCREGDHVCEVHELWETLETEYTGGAYRRIEALMWEFERFKFEPNERLRAGLARFQSLVSELEYLDVAQSHIFLRWKLQKAMPQNTKAWQQFHHELRMYGRKLYEEKKVVSLNDYMRKICTLAATHDLERSARWISGPLRLES